MAYNVTHTNNPLTENELYEGRMVCFANVDTNPNNTGILESIRRISGSDSYWNLAEEYEAKYDKELEIVVFAINTSDLNLSKLSIDTNNDSEEPTYFYNGVIPYTAMKKVNV